MSVDAKDRRYHYYRFLEDFCQEWPEPFDWEAAYTLLLHVRRVLRDREMSGGLEGELLEWEETDDMIAYDMDDMYHHRVNTLTLLWGW